jgi:hypothetical protein
LENAASVVNTFRREEGSQRAAEPLSMAYQKGPEPAYEVALMRDAHGFATVEA